MKKFKSNESGAIMIEATIVMVVTMLMLIWILAICFLYYQKYTVRIVTNDVAKKVAATYDLPSTDVITGYIDSKELTSRNMYFNSGVDSANDGRADSYVRYMLARTNFYGTVDADSLMVDVEPTQDAMGRSHIKVTTTCTFKTPFGAGLQYAGMSDIATYKVTAYADSTSLSDYVSTVNVSKAFTSGSILKGPKVVSSIVKMVNSFMGLYGQLTEE